MMDRVLDLLSRLARVHRIEDVSPLGFAMILLVSLASAFFLSWLYRRSMENRQTGSGLERAFPLLSLSITAIFLSVQFSLPLSLGLLGALSIVRFRTPVKEPEEIGFLMVVIAASLACATFNVLLLGLVLVAALAALWVGGRFSRRGSGRAGTLTVRMPDPQRLPAVREALRDALGSHRALSVASGDEGVTLAVAFGGCDETALCELSARLREAAPGAAMEALFLDEDSP